VLRIRASQRSGPLNFVTCVRQALIDGFPTDALGLGGVFQIEAGRIKAHVMPDFTGTDLLTKEAVEEWLRFYEMSAPLTCCSVLISRDLEKLGLRMEHTHFWSDHGEGGHYHYDLTPDEVVYDGYFVPAEEAYRIGPPQIDPNRTCFFAH